MSTMMEAPETVEAFVAPVSFAQGRLWTIDRLEPGVHGYAVPLALRLRGRLDEGVLQRVLDALAERHESLRTVFRWIDGEAMQVVLPERPLPLRAVDVAGEEAARRSVLEEIDRPFDLEAGPLARARLYRIAEEDAVFLLNLHHIVTDGWSNAVLLREIETLYAAFLRGEPSPLPEPELQYADFAEWQRERLSGVVLEGLLAYWREALEGAPALLELPTDRPRPAVWRGGGAVEHFSIGAEADARVQALARAEGATPFMVYLAAYALLLCRYARAEEVVIGTPIANRTRPETEGMVGFFVNTLPIRANLSGDPSFRALLARVRETTLAAYAHQDLPFERMVDDLRVPRSTAHAPVFQAMFMFQTAGEALPSFPGMEVRGFAVEEATRKPYDLTLALRPHAAGVMGGLDHSTALFDRETAIRMLSHFATLVDAACAAPDTAVSDLPLMAEAEEAAVLAAARGPALDLPEATVHALFEAQAARTPEAIALVHDGGTLTYAELDREAERVAAFLRGRGVGPETLVALCADRSPELMAGLIGILKSGGAYVPLDPGYPADRLAFMAADSGARILLAQRAVADRLPPFEGEVAFLDGDLPGGVPAGRVAATDPDALAYVIYTSGSTGRPKGAMNAHRAVVNRLLWGQDRYPLGPGDRVLQKTPFSFDVSVTEMFEGLIAGGTLVIARPDGHRDAAYLADAVRRHEVTVLHFVPSMLQLFLEEAGVEGCRTLRRVVCTGEPVTPELAARFAARLPGVELQNLYGPTEAAVEVTHHVVRPEDGGASVPIGMPVANTGIHLLDGRGRAVPAGVPGELFIGGAQVGRGYWRRPALTAERFLPDPFAGVPGARIYRSGDLAKRLPSDEVECLGRTDFQVKLRGFRIELGEVEAALAAHPAVREAVALVREDRPGDRRLVAYLVPAGGAPIPAAAALRDWLAGRLPAHMAPSAFVPLEALPLTPNGKVDRRALPAPPPPEAAGARAEADTPLESRIADFWRQILGTERVGVDDNFFDLGGNSLLLIRLAARLGELGCTASPVDLLRFPTVRTQAALVGGGSEAPAAAPDAARAERLRAGAGRLRGLRGPRAG